jgi:predicted Zn finger-like uncharacterized protein
MPILVACPNCAGQLRVADGLIGRKVRCPACNTAFDAPAEPPGLPRRSGPGEDRRDKPAGSGSAPAPPPVPNLELPVETERIDPWKSLNLELTPPEPPKPKGVREPEPEEDDQPRRPRKARLNDDHDNLRPCPGCGRMVYRDARRCVACGERLGDDDPDDDVRYERRRRKRDWEPHRAGFVLTMGVISLAVPFACWPLAFLGVIPGILAWAMGSGDLAKMRRGEMDPDGQGNTQAGWICGIIGTLINALVVLGCGAVVAFVWAVDVQKTNNRGRPGLAPPPPPIIAPR